MSRGQQNQIPQERPPEVVSGARSRSEFDVQTTAESDGAFDQDPDTSSGTTRSNGVSKHQPRRVRPIDGSRSHAYLAHMSSPRRRRSSASVTGEATPRTTSSPSSTVTCRSASAFWYQ